MCAAALKKMGPGWDLSEGHLTCCIHRELQSCLELQLPTVLWQDQVKAGLARQVGVCAGYRTLSQLSAVLTLCMPVRLHAGQSWVSCLQPWAHPQRSVLSALPASVFHPIT